jgi:hypothetical protein
MHRAPAQGVQLRIMRSRVRLTRSYSPISRVPGEIKRLLPTQTDKKLLLLVQFRTEVSSRPKRSELEGPAVPSTTNQSSIVPNRGVIPTGAKRSGGTCCSLQPLTNLPWKHHPPFVIPTEPGFPATLSRKSPRVRPSVKKGAGSAPTPPTSTGNPGERSEVEGSAVPRTIRGNVFHATIPE